MWTEIHTRPNTRRQPSRRQRTSTTSCTPSGTATYMQLVYLDDLGVQRLDDALHERLVLHTHRDARGHAARQCQSQDRGSRGAAHCRRRCRTMGLLASASMAADALAKPATLVATAGSAPSNSALKSAPTLTTVDDSAAAVVAHIHDRQRATTSAVATRSLKTAALVPPPRLTLAPHTTRCDTTHRVETMERAGRGVSGTGDATARNSRGKNSRTARHREAAATHRGCRR